MCEGNLVREREWEEEERRMRRKRKKPFFLHSSSSAPTKFSAQHQLNLVFFFTCMHIIIF